MGLPQILLVWILLLNLSTSLDIVLYVPRFPFSHISVSKITKDLNYSVTFFSLLLCLDLKTGRKIGSGAEHGGLY